MLAPDRLRLVPAHPARRHAPRLLNPPQSADHRANTKSQLCRRPLSRQPARHHHPNPIEQVFAKLKCPLRKAAERSSDAVCDHIGPLLDAFTPQGMRQPVRQLRLPTNPKIIAL
jgi:hypothetical protein